MKTRASSGIGRRQALRRLVVGAGAASAIPRVADAKPAEPKAALARMPMPQEQALGVAEPPDPALASPDWKPKFFDEHENETVVMLSDLIIPDTDTPGAKAAQVNRFIDLYLAAESPETQKQYLQALAWLDRTGRSPDAPDAPPCGARSPELWSGGNPEPRSNRGGPSFEPGPRTRLSAISNPQRLHRRGLLQLGNRRHSGTEVPDQSDSAGIPGLPESGGTLSYRVIEQFGD